MGILCSAALLQIRPSGHELRDALWVYFILQLAADPLAGHELRGALWVYLISQLSADPPAGHESQGVLCVHFEAGFTSAKHIIMYYDGLYLRIRALKLLLYSCPLFYQIFRL